MESGFIGIEVVGSEDDAKTAEFLDAARKLSLGERVLPSRREPKGGESDRVPFAVVCVGMTCYPAVNDINEMNELLNQEKP